jgi:hypothetical protein
MDFFAEHQADECGCQQNVGWAMPTGNKRSPARSPACAGSLELTEVTEGDGFGLIS